MNNIISQKMNKEYLGVFLISILLMSLVFGWINAVSNLEDYYFETIKETTFYLIGTFLYYFLYTESLIIFVIFFIISTSLLQNSYLVKIQNKEEFSEEVGENKEILESYKYSFSYINLDKNNKLEGEGYLFSGSPKFNVNDYKIIFKVSKFSKSFILRDTKIPDRFLETGYIFNDVVIGYLIKINISLLLRYIILITLLLSPHIVERFI